MYIDENLCRYNVNFLLWKKRKMNLREIQTYLIFLTMINDNGYCIWQYIRPCPSILLFQKISPEGHIHEVDILVRLTNTSQVLLLMTSTRVSLKVLRLTKIFSWNVTKWGLFFNIVPLVVHTLLSSVLQCLDPIGQKVINSNYMTSA